MVSRTLPGPETPGLRRYGFHGLSYAYLLGELELLRVRRPRAAASCWHIWGMAAASQPSPVDTSTCIESPTGWFEKQA